MEDFVDVATESRNRCIRRVGLGGPKTCRHLAGSGYRTAATLHVGSDTGSSAKLDSTIAESICRSSRCHRRRAKAWSAHLRADARRFSPPLSGEPADAV